MDGTTIALLLLIPATAVFVYAGWSEYRRFREDGPSNYGLTYDPETNTTHVGPLPDGEDSYNPDDFTPEADTDPSEDNGDEAEETPTGSNEQDSRK